MCQRLVALLLLSLLAFVQPAAAKDFASERITVTVVGSGPDVVLIPGLSSSPDVWKDTIAAVPGYRYHLVKVDGFDGAPPKANATGPVLVPVAEEVARYIDESHLKAPALVGHSMGGSIAMLVAERHPGLAGRLMIVDMMPYLGAAFGATSPEAATAMATQIRAGIAGGTGDVRKARTEQTIARMIKTEPMRPSAVAQSLASDPAVSGQAMYDLITTDLGPELVKVKVPMTVLWVVPAGAPLTMEQYASFYRMSYAKAPQAVLTNIPDSYHFIMYDQPERFRSELRTFLAAK